MSWRITIPSVVAADFAQTVELVKEREKAQLARLGASHASAVAGELAKKLIADWNVAKDETRTFGAVLSGHANPSGEAPNGFGNDEINVKVWRSGNVAPVTIVPSVAPAPTPSVVAPVPTPSVARSPVFVAPAIVPGGTIIPGSTIPTKPN